MAVPRHDSCCALGAGVVPCIGGILQRGRAPSRWNPEALAHLWKPTHQISQEEQPVFCCLKAGKNWVPVGLRALDGAFAEKQWRPV